jgi:hypothetical protein
VIDVDTDPVVGWLLAPDADPSIRWQAMRDLADASAAEVAAERAKVTTEGWGARLLAARDPDGLWAGGAFFPATPPEGPGQPWTATQWALTLLKDLGLPPDTDQAQQMIARVRDRCRWEHDGQRFFDGEVEPCINGRTVAIGAYFGQDVTSVVERLLGEQIDDGGWNCEQENGATVGSIDTTINVVEGLLEFEDAFGPVDDVASARRRGEEYLLERRLFRRRSTGEVADPDFLRFAFPPRWHHDVLRGLEHLRRARPGPDERLDEALTLVRSKRDAGGRWPLEHVHPGDVHFHLETEGEPSRWNTLRARRVLRWAGG